MNGSPLPPLDPPLDPERLDYDAEDAAAGNWLMGVTILLLVAILAALVVLGYRRAALLGWPVALWLLMTGLRLWKRMLRSAVTEAEMVVDHDTNIFDDTTAAEALGAADAEQAARHARIATVPAVLLVLAHTAFITILWYGIGRGIGAVVRWVA